LDLSREYNDASVGERYESMASAPATPTAGPAPAADDLFSLLGTQDADGAFGNPAMLATMLQQSSRDLRDLTQRIKALLGQIAAGKTDRIVQTLLAMFLLEQRFADRRQAWKRAWNKARSFVAGGTGVTPDEVERWVKELTK
jgi:hypothetical protein